MRINIAQKLSVYLLIDQSIDPYDALCEASARAQTTRAWTGHPSIVLGHTAHLEAGEWGEEAFLLVRVL